MTTDKASVTRTIINTLICKRRNKNSNADTHAYTNLGNINNSRKLLHQFSKKSFQKSFKNLSFRKRKHENESIEEILLKQDHNDTDTERRQALYQQITEKHATYAVAVIFILSIDQREKYTSDQLFDHQNSVEELDPYEKLHILQDIRKALKTHVYNNNFRHIKHDDERIFVICDDPIAAMKGMLHAQKVISAIQTNSITVRLRAGCGYGNLFELSNDYFGDPVNIASKLAEDIDETGQLFVSFGGKEEQLKYVTSFHDAIFTPKSVHISGVDIEFYLMEAKPSIQDSLKEKERRSLIPLKSKNNSHGAKVTAQWQDITMLQSDLSGFTRLTKKYGILHFLTLILHCRRIFHQNIHSSADGQVFKYDGDNIICKFQSSKNAIEYLTQVRKDLDSYNAYKEKDFQIRVKFGLSQGKVLVSNAGDIVGESWEECCALAEDTAKVGEILMTEEVKHELEHGTSLACAFEVRSETSDVPQHYNLTI